MARVPVLEVVLFRLKEGVSDEQFLESATGVQRWLEQQPGYLQREIAWNEEGQWLDLILWQTLEEAHQAAEQVMQQPEGQAFGALILGESIQMLHLRRVQQFQ